MTKQIQVLYISKLVKGQPLSTIDDILNVSRKNNAINNVSGVLLFRNGEFLQLLEGDKLDVYYTLKKIRDDKRHTGLEILHEGEIQHKLFDKWSMAYKPEGEKNPEINDRVTELFQKNSIKNNLQLMSLLNKFYY